MAGEPGASRRSAIAGCRTGPPGAPAECKRRHHEPRFLPENRMAPVLHRVRPGDPMDILFIVATVVFFAVSLAYVSACDRL